MSNWSSYQFTRKGEQLRAKVEAGKCKLTLTKIKIGNGDVTLGEVKDMNDLKSPQLVLGISSCAVSAEDDRVCEVVGIASSSNVENAFSVTEMGLYANDPDVGEILYLVEIDTSPDDMPNKNAQSPVTLTYQIELVTSNTANATAMVSPAGLVTVKMMNTHREATELDHPDGSVTTAKIHDEAVTGEKIAKQSVTGDHIADGAIEKAHLSQPLVTLIKDSGIAILQRSKAYQVGDIAYHKSLPSWARLECVKAGTTGATLPNLSDAQENDHITDGTVEWVVEKTATVEQLTKSLTGKADCSLGNILESAKTVINDAVLVRSLLAENGYIVFANGLIIQWGIVKNGVATKWISFPISYGSKVFHINFSSTISSDQSITNSAVQRYSLTGMEVFANTSINGYVLWFALGI